MLVALLKKDDDMTTGEVNKKKSDETEREVRQRHKYKRNMKHIKK